MKDIRCRLGLHKWITFYDDWPCQVQRCARECCEATRSTTYDPLYGETYWVAGDLWSGRLWSTR